MDVIYGGGSGLVGRDLQSMSSMKLEMVFDGIERPVCVLKEHILRALFDWFCDLGQISSISFLEFIDSLSL